MIVTGTLPSREPKQAARKASLWRTYAELPDEAHTLLADSLAQHLIAADADLFARLLAEAEANA